MNCKKILYLFASFSMLSLCACSYSKFEDKVRAQTEKADMIDDDDKYNYTVSDNEETKIETSGAKVFQQEETVPQVDPYGQQINYMLKNVIIGKHIDDLHIKSETAKQEIKQNLQENSPKKVFLLKAEFEIENVSYLGFVSEHTEEKDKYIYYIQNQIIPSNLEQCDVQENCECIYFSEHGTEEKNYNEFSLPQGTKKKIFLVWTLPKELKSQNLYFDVSGSVGIEKNYIQLR